MAYNQNVLHWVATITNGMLTSILIGTNIVSIYKACTSKNKKSVLLTSSAGIIFFTLTAILIFAACVVSLVTNDNTSTSMAANISFLAMLTYLISQTIMVFTFAVRVDKTFQDTDLAYSKCLLRALYAACILLFISGFSILLSMVFGLWDLMSLFAIVWIFLYFSTTIALIVLFIRKIEELMIMRYKSERENSVQSVVNSNSSNSSIQTDTNKNTAHEFPQKNDRITKAMINSRLFVIVVKHGLLVPVAITSSVICVILDVATWVAMGGDQFHAAASFWFILNATISSWCIFLLFAFNHALYNKLCHPMHRSCEKCELWKLKRSNKLKIATQMTQKASM